MNQLWLLVHIRCLSVAPRRLAATRNVWKEQYSTWMPNITCTWNQAPFTFSITKYSPSYIKFKNEVWNAQTLYFTCLPVSPQTACIIPGISGRSKTPNPSPLNQVTVWEYDNPVSVYIYWWESLHQWNAEANSSTAEDTNLVNVMLCH